MVDHHRHESQCWGFYEPCGEHHAHDYNCGNGDLTERCPKEAARLAKKKSAVAEPLTEEEVAAHRRGVQAMLDGRYEPCSAAWTTVERLCDTVDALRAVLSLWEQALRQAAPYNVHAEKALAEGLKRLGRHG